MKKTLIWAFVLFLAILYALGVYSWLLEGDAYRRQQEIERELEYINMSRH